MQYTIEAEQEALSVWTTEKPTRQVQMARFLHLPNATLKTAAMFGQYTQNSWPTQPEYATFSFQAGSPVYKWQPSDDGLMTIEDSPDLEKVGYLKSHRIIGEIARKGTILILELDKVSI